MLKNSFFHNFAPLLGAGICLAILVGTCTGKHGDRQATTDRQQKIEQNEHQVTAYYGGQKAFSYVYDESQHKPYLKELYSPGGLNFLLDSPEDHKHHHGLMFAIKVDGTNFWEEIEHSGRQEPENTTGVYSQSDEEKAELGFSSVIDWVRPENGEILLIENRILKLNIPKAMNVRILTWSSELRLPENRESAELTGSHYHGLGMRFIRSMDENGDFFTANMQTGEIFRGEERLIPDSWCAYAASVAGEKAVTIAMFGDPHNPGGNTVWFTMKTPFAYLAATMALHEKPFLLKSGETLSLRYGVAVWDGRVGSEEIERVYQYWLTH